MREYKGWIISEPNHAGMWSASNYSEGYGTVSADTLLGLKQLITYTMDVASC
jgi:hypothetical protein